MPANIYDVVLPALLALFVSAALIGTLRRSRAAAAALDIPNHRSLHVAPVPRIGGLGILAGILAAGIAAGFTPDLRVLGALVLLAAVSLTDDLRNLGVAWRMLAHLFSAALAATALVYESHGLWPALGATFAIAWMTNLYNFMDGSDGLAGGMAACGFGSFGVAALLAGDLPFATLNLAIAASALGFLAFNLPPARVFMGDAGSIPLGFLAAVCAIAGWQRNDWPLWFGVVVFSPFIIDATLTLLKRLARGARIWQAHREHYYQLLVQAGWGHRTTLLAELALMLLVSATGLVTLGAEPATQSAVLLALAAAYGLLAMFLERRFRPRSVPHAAH